MIDVTCSSPEALEPRSIAAPDKRGLATTLSRLAPSEFSSFAASEISRHHTLRRPAETTGKSSDPQNPQWCTAAKFFTSCGCGCTSESTFELMLIDGHGTAAADGFPVATKLVQALRMLAASAS